MNEFHNLNLEYLRVLNSIMETKSATKTAKSLGVTQSAVSHSLKKLREILGDEIVFRQGNNLELTARAVAMKSPLSNWMEQLDSVLSIEEFNPLTSKKVFYIATTDIVEQLYIPDLIKILQKRAPHIQVRVIRWEYERIEPMLVSSQIDFAIGVRTFDSGAIVQRQLYEERFVSMVRKKHPILKGGVNLEDFLSYPHVMAGPGDGRGAVDNYLEKLNRKRELLYSVNSFSSTPSLVENSDCILTAPLRFLNNINKKYKTEIFETPIDMRSFSVKLYWAKKFQKDQANMWMRDILYEITEKVK